MALFSDLELKHCADVFSVTGRKCTFLLADWRAGENATCHPSEGDIGHE
jgi:hypothetical protein